jgi:hypothetical protein
MNRNRLVSVFIGFWVVGTSHSIAGEPGAVIQPIETKTKYLSLIAENAKKNYFPLK